MLDSETRANDGLTDDLGNDADLISQLADMSIATENDNTRDVDSDIQKTLHPSNPVFHESHESSKIIRVVKELKVLHQRSKEKGVIEKAVVVSQWTSMLEIVKSHISQIGIKCTAITGRAKWFDGTQRCS